MAAANRKHGKTGQIKIDPAGGASTVAVASLDAWDLDMSTDTVDVTSFEDTNKTYVQGLPDLKGTFTGNYDSVDGLILFDIFSGGTPVTLDLIPDRNEATIKFTGLAYLNGRISVPANGKIAVSGSFVAAGPWTLPGAP
jgi:hypothetical protein